MGHLGPLVLCTRAMNTLHFMEPYTMRATQVEVNQAASLMQYVRCIKREREEEQEVMLQSVNKTGTLSCARANTTEGCSALLRCRCQM